MVRRAMSGAPHDALVKSTFGDVAVAREHLAALLPPRLAAAIDWSSLRVESGSFVDDALAHAHSDLLYSADLGDERALVFVLFEHQSTFDRWMPLRLLHYIASVWKRWLASNADASHAPPIVAVVLHHSDAGWRAAPELATVFAPAVRDAFGELLPTLRFVLDDISKASIEDLERRAGHALARLCLLALRSGSNIERLREAAPHLAVALRAVPGTAAQRAALVRLCQYLWKASEVDQAELEPLLVRIAGAEYSEDVMTAAEQLENRGRVKGLRDVLKRILVARGIRLSDLGQARLEACTESDLLDEWVVRAATAATEAELFGR